MTPIEEIRNDRAAFINRCAPILNSLPVLARLLEIEKYLHVLLAIETREAFEIFKARQAGESVVERPEANSDLLRIVSADADTLTTADCALGLRMLDAIKRFGLADGEILKALLE